jgi:hypothetical protein
MRSSPGFFGLCLGSITEAQFVFCTLSSRTPARFDFSIEKFCHGLKKLEKRGSIRCAEYPRMSYLPCISFAGKSALAKAAKLRKDGNRPGLEVPDALRPNSFQQEGSFHAKLGA